MPKNNPMNLNALQLRTLAILQRLAMLEGPDPASGNEAELSGLPHAHGDHMHIGHSVMQTRDASGLYNPSVWAALHRKGLVGDGYPNRLVLTAEAMAYQTGDTGLFLEHSDH